MMKLTAHERSELKGIRAATDEMERRDTILRRRASHFDALYTALGELLAFDADYPILEDLQAHNAAKARARAAYDAASPQAEPVGAG